MPKPRTATPSPEDQRDKFITDYIATNPGLTAQEYAKHLGYSMRTLMSVLQRHGVRLQRGRPIKMLHAMTAHVNEIGIVFRLVSLADNPSSEEWERLLDELKSHHIPSFYKYGRRMSVDADHNGRTRAVMYFTTKTVKVDEAIAILKERNITVFDVRGKD